MPLMYNCKLYRVVFEDKTQRLSLCLYLNGFIKKKKRLFTFLEWKWSCLAVFSSFQLSTHNRALYLCGYIYRKITQAHGPLMADWESSFWTVSVFQTLFPGSNECFNQIHTRPRLKLLEVWTKVKLNHLLRRLCFFAHQRREEANNSCSWVTIEVSPLGTDDA